MTGLKLNPWVLVFGTVGGAVACWTNSFIVNTHLNVIIKTGLFIALLAFFVVGLALLAETLFPLMGGRNWRHSYASSAWKYFLLASVVPAFLLGALFQAIYRFEIHTPAKRDIYMLIDCSGSMSQNDPFDERLAAVRRLIDGFDRGDRVEIIAFDHSAEVIQELTETNSAERKDLISGQLDMIKPSGGTDFNAALSLAYARIEQNRLQGSSQKSSLKREVMVIMLSDGDSQYSTENLVPFINDGIKINTVGLLLPDQSGTVNLATISEATDGQFVMVGATDKLDFALTGFYQTNDHSIIVKKETAGIDFVQWLMFISAGLQIGGAAAFLFDNRYILKPLIAGGFVGGLLAGGLLCLPIGLLLPCMVMGCVFTCFTVFAKDRD